MTTTSRSDQTADEAGGQMTLMEHLTELRKRIMISLAAVVAGAIVIVIFFKRLLRDVLLPPYCDALNPEEAEAITECKLLITDPLEGLSVLMTMASYGGIALAMPIIMWQLWQFIAPGLYAHERRYGLLFVFCSMVLFALGAGLAYWSLPRALVFLVDILPRELADVSLRPQTYLNFIVKMTVGFGIGFQFPIVLIFLQIIGLVETDTLRKGRRFAVVGITILVAVLTPSGDPYTLFAMAIPMYLFYEISILFGRWWARRQLKKA